MGVWGSGRLTDFSFSKSFKSPVSLLSFAMPRASKNSIESVLQGRLDELKEESRKAMEAKGFKPFYTFGQGDNEITFDFSVPRGVTQYGRTVYRATVAGVEYDVAMSPSLEKAALALILQTGEHSIIVTRVGTTQKDTRYSVRAA